ncbi:MAG: hypothetical protein CVT90_02245 [Candidatus Altiarchaeales archaeon HGW-Altiarchaeales-3]|nr:MAG: hypothetical protein CVT90_02245 [Candidatus Altiarchaeales archaeon HGW-Altiarchaeales-3]
MNLTNIILIDDTFGNLTLNLLKTELAPQESTSFTITRALNSTTANVVNATGTAPDNNIVTDTDMANVSVTVIPVETGCDCSPPTPTHPKEPKSKCGDEVCEGDETPENCPDDCPVPQVNITCGDKVCEGDENYENCPGDCPVPQVNITCGDGKCEGDETPENCPGDCLIEKAIVCGDGKCEGDETPENCPGDCPISTTKNITCGDKVCEGDENYENCPGDCPMPAICGDGLCDETESCETCEDDCGACKPHELILNYSKDITTDEPVEIIVTDENGNPVPGVDIIVTMPDGTTMPFTTDKDGKVKFFMDQPSDISVVATKKGYEPGEKADISITKETSKLWYLLPLVPLLLLLLLLIRRKKKVVADFEFLDKALDQRKLYKIINKFKKIYVTPGTYTKIMDKINKDPTYSKIMKEATDKNKIERVELDDNGNRYLNEIDDETVALAMQLGVKLVLTEELKRFDTAQKNDLEPLNLDKVNGT